MITISGNFQFHRFLCYFLTKLLILVIIFSIAVRTLVIVVAKLVILGILFLTSFVLALRFFILALYTSFLTTSFFNASLSLLKSTGTGISLSTIYQYLIYLH